MEVLKINDNPRWQRRLLIGTPTLGIIRYEWAHARYSQTVPVNWEAAGLDIAYNNGQMIRNDPIGFSIDDAYNLIVKVAIDRGVEWLLTIEDDVILPPETLVKIGQYMDKGDIPIVSGLYYLKAEPTQPLLFRGRGNGSYTKFKIGDKVWCDGLPMGILLTHMSIIKWFWENAKPYQVSSGDHVRRVFETPRKTYIDPETGGVSTVSGTQDLYFFDMILDNKVLQKTGWKKIGRKKYPFLCDTSIFCKHIDRATGRQFP